MITGSLQGSSLKPHPVLVAVPTAGVGNHMVSVPSRHGGDQAHNVELFPTLHNNKGHDNKGCYCMITKGTITKGVTAKGVTAKGVTGPRRGWP